MEAKEASKEASTHHGARFFETEHVEVQRPATLHRQVQDPGAEREAAASAAKIAVGQWISKAGHLSITHLLAMSLEIDFERKELMLDRTSRKFQELYSSYLIERRC